MATHQKEITDSFRTVTEMMRDRGRPCEQWEALSGEDVLALQGGRTVFHLDDAGASYRLVYDLSPRFKLSAVRKLLDVAPEVATQVILVVSAPTPAATRSLKELQLAAEVQMFDIKSLQFNVSRHDFVPHHEPIRDEAEIEAVVRRYSLKSRVQLPLIFSSDPMARYLGLRPGQLVRITRRSPSAGVHVLYRCCARAP